MTSRERVIKTLKHEEVDRIPRMLWALPGISMFRSDEYDEVIEKFPSDFKGPSFRYGQGKRDQGDPCKLGYYVDSWGSGWYVGEPGIIGEVKNFPLADWSSLDTYTLPWELLDEVDFSDVDRSCHNTSCFVLTGTQTRPFERMQFLRGTENLLADLAYGEAEVYKLRDMLHEFAVREMEMWANSDVDGVSFMDDWGSQQSLLISPALWREFYKPLYRDYCNILHKKGKYVFFHSDGFIEAIYPDLIEIGVDAVNSQLFCMDIEKLGELYSGKITFWGEIDRQSILPFGTVHDVRKAVDRAAKAFLKGKKTGVIAQCEWRLKDPKENILAVFDQWNKY